MRRHAMHGASAHGAAPGPAGDVGVSWHGDTGMRTVELNGYRIHSMHAGAGPAIVLVHGLAGSHRWWRFTVPALAARFSVHVPELVGFGASRPAPEQPDFPGMADLLVRWLDRLDVARADIVGHSMGAETALHLAARAPDRVRRLVLVSAAGVPHDLSPAELLRSTARMVRPSAWGRPTFLATVAADSLRAGPLTLLEATRHILADDVRTLLPRVPHRTLLIWGEHDVLTPVRDAHVLQAGLTDARLVVVPGAAHNVMADRPALFNRLVLDFLDDRATDR